MESSQAANQQVLRPVRVLVLIDHHVLELARVEVAHRLARLEQLHRLQQEVIEVERVGILERGDVALVDLRDLLVADVPGPAQRLGPFHPVLCLADAREGRARRHQLVVDAELALRLLDDGDLVGRVVDDEVAGEPNLRRLAAQQSRAQRVEGGQPDGARSRPDERLDTVPHLLRGLVGEGHRQHLIRARVTVADEVRNAERDDARLARAGAGEDQQRPFPMQHGLALLGVQLIEEVHEGILSIAGDRGLGARGSGLAARDSATRTALGFARPGSLRNPGRAATTEHCLDSQRDVRPASRLR